MLRRILGIGGIVIVLILLVLLVKSCRAAQKEQAFKDYNRDVHALIQESDDESQSLFNLLENGGASAVDIQSQVNGYAQESAQLASRAKGTSHPGELDTAHGYLVETLEFRRDGLRGIAAQLPAALGNRGDVATKAIAAQMQLFLASDVIYDQRFKPQLAAELKTEGLSAEKPPNSLFLHDISWLDQTSAQDRIGRIGSGGSSGTTGTIAPGLHGTGLGTVTYQPGGVQLNAGGGNQLKIGPNPSFDVQVMNQGENDEKNVKVNVSIKGGSKPISLNDTLPTIAAGQSKTVSISLSSTPPAGQPVTIVITIAKVPGEKKTDNNRATFNAVFSK
jgi:hypothetical protein